MSGNPTVIVSYELLAGATADQAAAAIADLGDAEVHVVFTARDFGRSLASAWQERLKFAVPTPLEDFKPRQEEDGPRAEWGWRTMDPTGVLARWGAGLPAERVHLVTVPGPGAPPDTLWRRFAEGPDRGDRHGSGRGDGWRHGGGRSFGSPGFFPPMLAPGEASTWSRAHAVVLLHDGSGWRRVEIPAHGAPDLLHELLLQSERAPAEDAVIGAGRASVTALPLSVTSVAPGCDR